MIRLVGVDGTPLHSTDRTFLIGRSNTCDLVIPSGLVSREHARVETRGDAWWVVDLGSTNGTIVDGLPQQEAPLRDGTEIQFGPDGPRVRVQIRLGNMRRPSATVERRPDADPRRLPVTRPEPAGARAESERVHDYWDHVMGRSGRAAGEKTERIRRKVAEIQEGERRRRQWLIAVLVPVVVAALAYGIYQDRANDRLVRVAEDVLAQMREQDRLMAELRLVLAEPETERGRGARLLADLEAGRAQLGQQYDAYVREFGVLRRLETREDSLIYEVARTFNESQFSIGRDFIREIEAEIRDYWQSPRGRARLEDALVRATSRGYTRRIAGSLADAGLPVDFFYLALQESDFETNAVGEITRWGRAKGMWQFIPSTAQRYGLAVGSDPSAPGFSDPRDQRLDFTRSTDAATRYLLALHGELTHASGLLVMAAYNWGEHRVQPGLEDLPSPEEVFAATFDEVPPTAEHRSYWTFLREYRERIPDQTKDYVAKIFSAAVVGRDPRHFGFDFDDPLLEFRSSNVQE